MLKGFIKSSKRKIWVMMVLVSLYLVTGNIYGGSVLGAETNIAKGKTATASATEKNLSPEAALDGSMDAQSRWGTGIAYYPAWWMVDLGSISKILRIDIKWYSPKDRSYKYKLEVSDDGTNFKQIVDQTKRTEIGDSSDPVDVSARYIRITVTGGTGAACFYEFEVYGVEGTPGTGVAPTVPIPTPTPTAVQSKGNAQEVHNPLITQKYSADPSALEYNNKVYIYMSHDGDNQSKSTGYIMNDITCISSDDLVNWTDHGEVFQVNRDIKLDSNGKSWATSSWAPSVVYRKDTAGNDKFYMYFGNGASGIGVAVSDSPTGPFKDPLGHALINKSMPNCDVPWCFDPAVFVDDDGRAYLYFGGGVRDATGTAPSYARVIEVGRDMISTIGEAVRIDVPNVQIDGKWAGFMEASYMNKVNGKYYFSYASNTASRIRYMVSDKPMTGFKYVGIALDQPWENNSGNNHASIFSFQNKWYIAYHNNKVAKDNGKEQNSYNRSVCLDSLEFNADGTIKTAQAGPSGVSQIKKFNPYDNVSGTTMNRQWGIKTEATNEKVMNITSIENGDWIQLSNVDFGQDGAAGFLARVKSGIKSGIIELRLDSTDGTLIGSCNIEAANGSDDWTTVTCNVNNAKGIHDLYMVFKGETGIPLFKLGRWSFSKTKIDSTAIKSFVGVNPEVVQNSDSVAAVKESNDGKIKVTVDGKLVEFEDVAPQIVNDRTLVPFRKIFEVLGAAVAWNDETQTAIGTKGDKKITLQINNKVAMINGVEKELDVAPTVIDNRTMVPARVIAEGLGATVTWDESTNTVVIKTK